jgi:hypothetical protein
MLKGVREDKQRGLLFPVKLIEVKIRSLPSVEITR